MKELLTEFGEKLDKIPLNDYPRPQLRRNSFFCLNGEWDYSILSKETQLNEYQGKILVPFSPECLLSGVQRVVTEKDLLHYRRFFTLPKDFSSGRVLLHFGAVDYHCVVEINSVTVGANKGGYYPFSFDITDALKKGENEIKVTVSDPGDTSTQARGKQKTKRGGIWYTPQSGIWQTVWMENVPASYIESIKIIPDIDSDTLYVKVNMNEGYQDALVKVFDSGKQLLETKLLRGEGIVKLKEYQLWSPENPKLYDLVIQTETDVVESYFGMRKYSVGTDENGIPRLMLNNKPYFHNGLLDQGYWSDGMYTPPSDEAMIYDIKTMKDLGFNMLRKHIKIEPLRWYYHCDRMGMLVWQDMINGGGHYKFSVIGGLPFLGIKIPDYKYKPYAREDAEGRAEYYVDSERMIDTLFNTVSIAVWVPFNEGWGQFDSCKAYEFYKQKDPTRTIDHASGWHDHGCGDFKSLHIYFRPVRIKKDRKKRPVVLSEFGGYSYQVKGHSYDENKVFGYRIYKDSKSFEDAYVNLYEKQIIPHISKGLSATVYTEVSDVEDECNGLLTYDRKVLKVDMKRIKALNEKVKL